MRVLAVDIGTGTQDILLFDSATELENGYQLVLPSPTRIVAGRVGRATAARRGLLLTGVTMGGGPGGWAIEEHLRQGLPVYATADAARTLDDDLDRIERIGIRLVDSPSDAPADLERVELRDLDLPAIAAAFTDFGVNLAGEDRPDVLAVAVFDHGAAPPNVSDRAFRFEYIAETVVRNDLTAFSYLADEVPARLTRMAAVATTASAEESPLAGVPLLVMDTGPAAVLGALDDARVRAAPSAIVANIGNFHTLAFHVVRRASLADGTDDQAGSPTGWRIAGLFEHHTGELSVGALERYLCQLGDGSVSNAEVFADKGHGAFVSELLGKMPAGAPALLAVVGPRRRMLAGSALAPYFAVPHGDMMIAGCFGLLRAVARKLPRFADEIDSALERAAI